MSLISVRGLNIEDRLYFMLKSPIRRIGGPGYFRRYVEMAFDVLIDPLPARDIFTLATGIGGPMVRRYFAISTLVTVLLLGNINNAVAQNPMDLFGMVQGFVEKQQRKVKEVQRLLADAGYYTGEIDGEYGSGTIEAARRFQKDIGSKPTGKLSKSEIRELRKRAQQGPSQADVADAENEDEKPSSSSYDCDALRDERSRNSRTLRGAELGDALNRIDVKLGECQRQKLKAEREAREEEARQATIAERERQERELAEETARQQQREQAEAVAREEQRQAQVQREIDTERAKKEADAKAASDLELLKAEALIKGPEFAASSKTNWEIEETISEMTDKKVVKVKSLQDNGMGAVAEIVGECDGPQRFVFWVTFGKKATVFDINDPSTDLPLAGQVEKGLQIERRYNNDLSGQTLLRQGQFSNQFLLLALNLSDKLTVSEGDDGQRFLEIMVALMVEQPSHSTVWRAIYEVRTGQGNLNLRVPTYQPNILKAIASCRESTPSSTQN